MTERLRIDVRNEGTYDRPRFVAEWDGQRFEAGNPFGLDSQLFSAGCPAPHDLYLVADDEAAPDDRS